MRKKLFYLGAILIASGVGAYGTAYYACSHPQSFLGRCATTAYNLNADYNPLCQASRNATSSAECSAPACDPAANAIPAEPQLIVPPGAWPEPVVPNFTQPAIDVEKEAQRTPINGTRIIEGNAEESEPPALFMPPIQDEQPPVPLVMPYADDEATASDKGHSIWHWLFPGSSSAGAEESETGDVNGQFQDGNYHRTHPECPGMNGSCCPYTGKCYSPASQEKTDAPSTGKQSSKHFKISLPEVIKEMPEPRSDVDTTECRPSDAKLNRIGSIRY